MAEIKYEVTEKIGVLGEAGSDGYAKEINLVSWNGHPALYDIRAWNEAHDRMKKGITLNKEEIKNLRDVLNNLNLED